MEEEGLVGYAFRVDRFQMCDPQDMNHSSDNICILMNRIAITTTTNTTLICERRIDNFRRRITKKCTSPCMSTYIKREIASFY